MATAVVLYECMAQLVHSSLLIDFRIQDTPFPLFKGIIEVSLISSQFA